jgi:hypothetical protein
MDDPNRLCQEDIHTTSDDVPAPSTASIIDEDNKNLDAFLIQDPQQLLELELIHAVPKDPVLDVIFRHLDSQALHKHVAVYLKINFIKLAAIHAMKETDQKEADLVLSLQALEVDTTKFTIYARDEPAQKANKAARALTQKHKRVTKKSALQLNWFIRHSTIQVPNVYRRTNVDDLCAVWYAVNSDSHYSCSESLGPCHPLEFRVLVITHLHLIGGTPSQHKILKKPKRTSYQHFLDLLPGFLSMARCSQTGRLGYSTKAPTTGPWLLQSASSLEALDVDRWTTLCEETYDVLRRDTSQVVFLVHVSFSISYPVATAVYTIKIHDLFQKQRGPTESPRIEVFLWILLCLLYIS